MTIHDGMMELLNKEIDGVNSKEDSLILQAYLERNPEAACVYEELRELSSILGEARQLTPGAHVNVQIMNAVRSIASRRDVSPSLFSGFRVLLAKPAYTFAIGVALGCILLVTVARFTPEVNADASQLLGTLVNAGTLGNMKNIDTLPVSADGVAGEIITQRSGNALLVKVSLNAARLTTIHMTFEGGLLTFKGYVDLRNTSSQASVRAGALEYTLQGEHEYAILFEGNGSRSGSMTIEGTQGSTTIFSSIIDTDTRTTHR